MGEVAELFILGSFVAACSVEVKRLPRAGESLTATGFVMEPGGKGFNLAVGARRLGASVDGLIPIGDDPLADLAEPALRRAGLSSKMLRRFAGATGAGVGFIEAGGENCLAVHPGANLRLSADDVGSAHDAIVTAKIVLAQLEIGDEPVAAAFALARAAGVRTLLNPSPYRALDRAILAATSILVANAVETAELAAALCGRRSGAEEAAAVAPDLAAALFDLGGEALIVTLGARGALAFVRGEEPARVPAFAVEAVDTLGAGDAFAAGLAAALVSGLPWTEGVRRACACGALTAARKGVFAALPFREEVDAFLSREA